MSYNSKYRKGTENCIRAGKAEGMICGMMEVGTVLLLAQVQVELIADRLSNWH